MIVDPAHFWVSLFVRALGIVFALVIARSAICRIREGGFSVHGIDVHKGKNPFAFWAVIGVGLLGAGWLVVLAIR